MIATKGSSQATIGRLIIPIDSGTTRCEVAYAAVTHYGERFPMSNYNRSPPMPKCFKDWCNSNKYEARQPITALYYSKSDELPETGNSLETIIANPENDSWDVGRLFRLWKLLFHLADSHTIREVHERLRIQLLRFGKTRQDLLRDWVGVIYNELLTEGPDNLCKLGSLLGNLHKFGRRCSLTSFPLLDFVILYLHLGRFSPPPNLSWSFFQLIEMTILIRYSFIVEIVVPVPPGRSAIAHEEVFRAFVQGPIKASQVSLVSEPEALFRWWLHENDIKDWKARLRFLSRASLLTTALQIGDRSIVTDVGGGTWVSGVTIHQIWNLKVTVT